MKNERIMSSQNLEKLVHAFIFSRLQKVVHRAAAKSESLL